MTSTATATQDELVSTTSGAVASPTIQPNIVLRAPNAADKEGYTQPPASFLDGQWHVTHSTLPMWKTKQNVSITYTALPPSSPSLSSLESLGTDRIDDLVSYQDLGGEKVHSIHGVDKVVDDQRRDAWVWRGKGWLSLVTSRWQVLGWGSEEGGASTSAEHKSGNDWAVTYFAKTMFTPAGVDFYSRGKQGLGEATLDGLKKALESSESEEIRALGKDLFAVKLYRQ